MSNDNPRNWSRERICAEFDTNWNLSSADLARITGRTIREIETILLAQTDLLRRWVNMADNRVRVTESQTLDAETGLKCITTPCADWLELRILPSAVVFEGRLYGKTGWNSDKHVAHYRTDAQIATPIAMTYTD